MTDINPTIGPFEAFVENLYNTDKASTIPAENYILQGSGSPRANDRHETLTNTTPVLERETTTLDMGEIKNFPMDLMRTIFSYNLMREAALYRKWKKKTLCICRALRGYLLKYENWQVALKYEQFLILGYEKQLEIMDLTQKIGVNFIVDEWGSDVKGNVRRLEDVYAAICRAPEVFKRAVIAVALGPDTLEWLIKKEDDANLVERIVRLNLKEVRITDKNCEATLNFIHKCKFLKVLRVNRITGGACVTIRGVLKALKFLVISEVWQDCIIKISGGLTALTGLSFECISQNVNITLEEDLPALNYFSIGFDPAPATIKLPASLKKNLKNLTPSAEGIIQWV